MNIVCVIPARFASTRLPGKPLADIAGKPMIQHVYERAVQAKLPQAVVVATDYEKVYRTVLEFGGKAVMTSPDHPTGTDRLAEVAASFPEADVLINIQGDEPLLEPEVIDQLAAVFSQEEKADMATLMTKMEEAEYNNPNAVKVVTDLHGYALYFSRSLLPYPRKTENDFAVYKHVGIYAYRREFLLRFASLLPTPLERMESLEQLRALEHGYKIKVLKTSQKFVGVDTPEDLAEVNAIIKECVSQNTHP